jgi:cystathionine beta-synthase
MQVCKELGPGKRVVVILPDSIRNYLTKFADDRWMRQQGFVKGEWEVGTVGDVVRALGRKDIIALDLNDRLDRATELFRQHGISQMPVLDAGKLAGILTESDLLHHLVSGRATKETIVAEVMERRVSTVALHASSGELPRIFERGEVAIVVDDQRNVIGILTKMDLIEMIARKTSVQ